MFCPPQTVPSCQKGNAEPVRLLGGAHDYPTFPSCELSLLLSAATPLRCSLLMPNTNTGSATSFKSIARAFFWGGMLNVVLAFWGTAYMSNPEVSHRRDGPLFREHESLLDYYATFLHLVGVPLWGSGMVSSSYFTQAKAGDVVKVRWQDAIFLLGNLLTPLAPISVWLLRRLDARPDVKL